MPDYKLISDYWDGEKMHPKGSERTFEEGKQPRTAKLVEKPKAKPVAKPE